MPPLTETSAAQHMAPGLRGIVGTRLGGRVSSYTRMYNVETSVRSYEDWLAATGLPIAVEKPRGTDIQSFDPREGATKRMSHRTYAIGFEVDEETWDDDLYVGQGSMIREAATGLADSLAERVEIESHRPFNAEGFDGASFTVLPDASGFFATTHNPVVGAQGIAQGNRPATNADLNVTSYRTALTSSRRIRDDQGKRIPDSFRYSTLVTPPELTYVAQEIVKSPTRPDQNNPALPNVTQMATGVEEDVYLDDIDSWFLRGNKHHAVFLWRWRPRMDSFDDRRARVAVHVAYMRFSFDSISWRGYYGSNGGA